MKWILATLSFLLVFACVFFAAGLLLMPHLPPTPARPVTPFEAAYWTDNWIGVLLGAPLGYLSARATLKRRR